MVRRAALIGGRQNLNIAVLPPTKEALIKLAKERNRTLSGVAAEILDEAMAVAS